MSARSLGRVVIGAWVLLSVTACGDDDAKSDAGPDGSTDAGTAGSGGNFIPRRDAAVAERDPIRQCDLADPASCPAGETCDVLVRQFAGEQALTIYAGCATTTAERALGDPCDPDFSATPPYQTPGLTDLVFRDQCGPDLVCGPDPDARGAGSCRPACHLGRAGSRHSRAASVATTAPGPGRSRSTAVLPRAAMCCRSAAVSRARPASCGPPAGATGSWASASLLRP